MLKVVNNKISMTRGDTGTFYCKINYSDANNTEYVMRDGDSLTLTIRAEAKVDPTSTHILQKTFTNNQITITPEETKLLEYGTYVYDIELTLADGTINTVIPINIFALCEEVT